MYIIHIILNNNCTRVYIKSQSLAFCETKYRIFGDFQIGVFEMTPARFRIIIDWHT